MPNQYNKRFAHRVKHFKMNLATVKFVRKIFLYLFFMGCAMVFSSSILASSTHPLHHHQHYTVKPKLLGHSGGHAGGGGHGGDSHNGSASHSSRAQSNVHATTSNHKAAPESVHNQPICDRYHTKHCRHVSRPTKKLTHYHLKRVHSIPQATLIDQTMDKTDLTQDNLAQDNDQSASDDESDNNAKENTSITTAQASSSDVKTLIHAALDLSKKQLAYHFGSDNPHNGGMDCSGTISFLLKNMGMNAVPRQADQIYKWVWEKGKFFAVNAHHFDSFEFSHLKPGDLLFWTDTYQVDRDPPITHVMLYLGKDKQGNPLMFGASEGRGENNQHLRGVNVFDFELPKNNSAHRARFIGYGTIPGIHYS